MVRHMVQDSLWDDLVYHLTHNLKDTHIKERILYVLWQFAPRLCHTLGLEYALVWDDASRTMQRLPIQRSTAERV